MKEILLRQTVHDKLRFMTRTHQASPFLSATEANAHSSVSSCTLESVSGLKNTHTKPTRDQRWAQFR